MSSTGEAPYDGGENFDILNLDESSDLGSMTLGGDVGQTSVSASAERSYLHDFPDFGSDSSGCEGGEWSGAAGAEDAFVVAPSGGHHELTVEGTSNGATAEEELGDGEDGDDTGEETDQDLVFEDIEEYVPATTTTNGDAPMSDAALDDMVSEVVVAMNESNEPDVSTTYTAIIIIGLH